MNLRFAAEKKVVETMSAEKGHEVMDRSAALERLGGDADLLADIAGLFLQEHVSILHQIHAARAAGNFLELERCAHNLKGGVANFAAREAWDAAFALECVARAGDLAGVGATLERLERELVRLRPALVVLASGDVP